MRTSILAFAAAAAIAGCGNNSTTIPDMKGGGDMAMSQADMTMGGMGKSGAPCTMNSDCGEGNTPICWKNLINNPQAPAISGGMCSSKCTTDTDCGSGVCNNYTSVLGTGGSWCVQTCQAATDCRMGFSCDVAFLSSTSGNATTCEPSSLYDCDPSAMMASCNAGTMTAMKPGMCIHSALGTGMVGVCFSTCVAGTGTCPASGNTPAGVCSPVQALNMKVDPSDITISVPICLMPATTPLADGATCDPVMAPNACKEGSGCSPNDKKCHPLCYSGTAPTPTAGTVVGACATGTTCMDDWGLFATAQKVGACR